MEDTTASHIASLPQRPIAIAKKALKSRVMLRRAFLMRRIARPTTTTMPTQNIIIISAAKEGWGLIWKQIFLAIPTAGTNTRLQQ